jgi:hypothetical protein
MAGGAALLTTAAGGLHRELVAHFFRLVRLRQLYLYLFLCFCFFF